MTEKTQFPWVHVSPGSGETLVRRDGIAFSKLPFDSVLTKQYLCQKLAKSVDVH